MYDAAAHFLPRNLQKEDERLFTRIPETGRMEVSLHTLSDVDVLTEGTVLKRMKVCKDLLLSNDQGYVNCPNWKGILGICYSYKKYLLPNDDLYVLVHHCYSHTYYHWLLEVLPRLFLVKDYFKTCKVLMPESHQQPFHQEALEVFGVKQVQLLKSKSRYKIKRLLAPSQIGRIANYPPALIRQTVNFIKERVNLDLNVGDKVYISRSKAARRCVLNEAAVIALLKNYGFTIIHFEDYSWEEQISIMHHCRYLVGLHGAGLANMIFMPENGRVFELRKYDGGKNYFFYSLASTVNHQYYYQFCSSYEEGEVQDLDISVDTDLLSNHIVSMLDI